VVSALRSGSDRGQWPIGRLDQRMSETALEAFDVLFLEWSAPAGAGIDTRLSKLKQLRAR
jgi:hypothetical protein